MKLFDIGELSRRTGLPASTLRYYDEIGLVSSVARHGLRRQFGPDALLRLSMIALCKSAGFSLDEIADMFSPEGAPELPRAELHQRADELDEQIRRLAALRDMLKHIADCPAPTHMECPKFRRLLREAGSARAGKAGGEARR